MYLSAHRTTNKECKEKILLFLSFFSQAKWEEKKERKRKKERKKERGKEKERKKKKEKEGRKEGKKAGTKRNDQVSALCVAALPLRRASDVSIRRRMSLFFGRNRRTTTYNANRL